MSVSACRQTDSRPATRFRIGIAGYLGCFYRRAYVGLTRSCAAGFRTDVTSERVRLESVCVVDDHHSDHATHSRSCHRMRAEPRRDLSLVGIGRSHQGVKLAYALTDLRRWHGHDLPPADTPTHLGEIKPLGAVSADTRGAPKPGSTRPLSSWGTHQ